MTNFGDEKYYMLIQRYSVQLIGFWPGSDDIKRRQLAWSILSPLEALIYAIFQVWFCVVNIADLVEFLRGVCPTITQILTAFKILSIVWKRKQFKEILDYLKDKFVNGNWYECLLVLTKC